MKQSQYGRCGLNCGACGATDCDGCLSDRVDEWAAQCRFRNCANGKGIASCAFCGECLCAALYEFMNDEWPHHHTIEPNLEFIRMNGVSKWLEAQRQEWSCGQCGSETHWYQKSCQCGQTLKAWNLPE